MLIMPSQEYAIKNMKIGQLKLEISKLENKVLPTDLKNWLNALKLEYAKRIK